MSKLIAVVLLSLAVGIIFGLMLYESHYKKVDTLMQKTRKYEFLFVVIPAVCMFAVGYLVGRGGQRKSKGNVQPAFVGQVRSLGKDGEKILEMSLKRFGIIREKK